jgi:threonine dehydratase
MLPSPDSIRAAASTLAGVAVRTPLRHSAGLSALAGTPVWLKLETEQITGSFKLRGAYTVLASLDAATRRRGVVASSAGNHGLGVAWAAERLGVPATIYVPANAPAVKKQGIAVLGARLDDSRPTYDEALAAAMEHASRTGARFVHPCTGDVLLAGQGTVALEITEQLPTVAAIVVPVGGAGLLGGVAGWLRGTAPEVRIIGAQSEHTAAMARTLAAGRLVEVPDLPTLADGLAGQIDAVAFEIGREALDDIAVISEAQLAGAIAWLSRHEGVRVEGAGAVGVGALLSGAVPSLPPSPSPVVIIVSGGNIDAPRHARLLAEAGAAPAGA